MNLQEPSESVRHVKKPCYKHFCDAKKVTDLPKSYVTWIEID